MTQERQDIELECKDCHIPFEFLAGEQAFYEENNLNPPKRCPMCRLKKRERYKALENNQPQGRFQ